MAVHVLGVSRRSRTADLRPTQAATLARPRSLLVDGVDGSVPSSPAPDVVDRLVGLSYAVVDVETTGGSPAAGHRITEIAAVVVYNGQVAETFETLVDPQRPIPPFISRLTHITGAMVWGMPTFRDIAPQIVDLLRGRVFVGHNAAFDRRFVTAETTQAGLVLANERVLCTVRLARRLLPHLRRRTLDCVAHYYGVPIAARHRAMGDAMATALCLLRLLDDAGSRGLDTWGDMGQLIGRGTGAGRRRRRASAMPRPAEWEWGA
jgi:DNA polymerase-3 subunit epsilon